ncbi:MAG: carbohydrate porin, partial [Chitinophagaceae bacterium]|nr:carbohydrate porin [Oligoflexus sp.]
RFLIPLVCVYCVILTPFAFPADTKSEGFEYHGYMRVGTGLSKNQTRASCYSLRNAGGNAFRFGNECGFYMESLFNYNFPKADPTDAVWFKTGLNLALMADGIQSAQTTTQNDFLIANREAYIDAGNAVSEGSILWVGKKFYKRRDIALFDYFLVDSWGTGGGLSEVSIGPGKFHFALMQYKSPTLFVQGTETAASPVLTNTDWRYDWQMQDSRLEAIILAAQKSSHPSDGKTSVLYETMRGAELGLIYIKNIEPLIQSRTFFQYGQGLFGASVRYGNLLNGFESDGTSLVKSITSSTAKRQLDRSSTTRLAEDFVYNGLSWEGAIAALYQVESFGGQMVGESTAKDRTSLVAGVRPSYYLNKHWKATIDSGVVEISHNSTADNDSQKRTQLQKNTLALQVSPKQGYFARPALRIFVTEASWLSSSRPYLENITGTYADQTDGLTYGVQAEAWW